METALSTTTEKKVRKKNKKKLSTILRDNWMFLLLVTPGALSLIIFFYIPVLANVVAFKDFQYSTGGFVRSLIESPWVGFKNFEFFLKSSDFWLVLRNTVGYNLLLLSLNFFFAIFFGIVMSQMRHMKLLKVFQTAMLFPHFLSWSILSFFLFAFISSDKGVINHMLVNFGKAPIDFYGTPEVWPFIIVFMGIWQGIGYNSILYFATASGIDPSQYDASMVDGANKWQQIWYIILPEIMPVATLMLILNIGSIFSSDFGMFYLLPRNSGPLINVTQTFDTYVYRALTTTNDIGMSTAAGLLQSVVGSLLMLTVNAFVRRKQPDSALF